MHSTRIAALGLSYHTAPIAIREQLACTIANLPANWQEQDGRFSAIHEIVILSTCNRTELYAALNCPGMNVKTLMERLLSIITGVETAVIAQHSTHYTGQQAVDHLCRVAAGLDSLVLGEPQILGQVTDAFMAATEAKTIGPALTALFRTAIRAGKRARTETEISANHVSTSSLAVAQAQAILGDITQHPHLVIGLGEMGNLALKALKARGVTKISVANRTRSRAEKAAQANGWQAFGLSELNKALAQNDVVISAVSSQTPIITQEMVTQVMAQRGKRPFILIDIAVPRNIDPRVAKIPHVHLFDADDIKSHLDEALAARQQQVPLVEAIIAQEIELFNEQLRQLTIKPVIVNLRHKAEAIRQQEMEKTLKHLGHVDPETRTHLDHLTRSLINKLLHEPTLRLKQSAGEEEAMIYAETLRDLFGLMN
ncbi:MAG: glutamyl-tRNA reductase [Candidatus Promineifilaceae bacterium]